LPFKRRNFEHEYPVREGEAHREPGAATAHYVLFRGKPEQKRLPLPLSLWSSAAALDNPPEPSAALTSERERAMRMRRTLEGPHLISKFAPGAREKCARVRPPARPISDLALARGGWGEATSAAHSLPSRSSSRPRRIEGILRQGRSNIICLTSVRRLSPALASSKCYQYGEKRKTFPKKRSCFAIGLIHA